MAILRSLSPRPVLILFSLLFWCHSALGVEQELTREQVARILSTIEFDRDQTEIYLSATVGHFVDFVPYVEWTRRYLLASDDEAQSMAREPAVSQLDVPRDQVVNNLSHLREVARHGLFDDFSFSDSKLAGYRQLFVTGIMPTEIGKLCTRRDQTNYQPGDDLCVGVIARRRFGAVTGIFGDNLQKTAEFSLIVEPTELGKRLGLVTRNEKRAARFLKYDDGWRLIGR